MVTEYQERKITKGLDLLIPKHLVGYKYLKTDILLAMRSDKINLEKEIYSEVAQKYGLTKNYVCLSISRTIDNGYCKNEERFEEFFGTADCYTPAKFIKFFVKKMKAEE